MKWLEGRLDEWNKDGQAKDKITVHPVWFYPWKYHEKEDVWRGLVAEVILKCLEVEGSTAKGLLSAATDLGRFLGASFVDLLSGTKIKAGLVEADLSKLQDVMRRAKEFVRPESAYLNEFETALERWVGKTLGKTHRMVIFIDDLDRCMPDVALQVLEALKLYLNIPKLFFVVGVDRGVVDALVRKHYEELGLGGDKSKNYLAKMFQLEATVAPSEPQVDAFLADVLKRNEEWQSLDADAENAVAKEVFSKVIRSLGAPREIKRLVNSALIAGAGARLSALGDQPDADSPTPAQGMQVFFVHRILDERHTRASMVGSAVGTDFFIAWSEAVASGADTTFRLPPQVREAIAGEKGDPERSRVKEQSENAFETVLEEAIEDIPEQYRAIVENPRFRPHLDLLADPDLGGLMRLPYPMEATAIGAALVDTTDAGLVREAVARSLDKNIDDLTDGDFLEVTELDLSNTAIADLEPLRSLSGLEELDAWGTQVTDLEALRGLSDLTRLDLSDTSVSDLRPLQGLSSLKILDLSDTSVSDLRPLRGLSSLKILGLNGTRVADLEPLHGLTNLEDVWLQGTSVPDSAVDALQAAIPDLEIIR